MVNREADYNSEGFQSNAGQRKEVGPNTTLFLPEGEAVPVSSMSFTEEVETSEVQYNDSFAQSIAVTGVTYSGSFTIPGNADDTRAEGWDDGGDDQPTLPRHIDSMTIQDGEGNSYTFRNVLLNSHSKDIPADDRSEQSFDFMAEALFRDPANNTTGDV